MLRRLFSLSSLFSLLMIIGVFYAAIEVKRARDAARIEGVVEWVFDGDTIRIAGHRWKIRLWGVDAPEYGTDEGAAARDWLRGQIMGKPAICEKVAVDKFRRTVARCAVDGVALEAALLAQGHAMELCGFTRGALGGPCKP